MNFRRTIGALLFVGNAQFVTLLMVAETQYAGYSIKLNYISDLGVWSRASAYIFNPSVFLMGLLSLVAGYLILSRLGWKSQGILIIIAALGSIGVGIFNETIIIPHSIFAIMAFIGGALAGIMFVRRLNGFLGYMGFVLGVVSLLALGLFGTGHFLGLGVGGMERMIVYPQIAFTLALGGYFLAKPTDSTIVQPEIAKDERIGVS